jgi:hypothetical protein
MKHILLASPIRSPTNDVQVNLRRFRCQKQSQLRQKLVPARSCFESIGSPQEKDNEK